MVFDKDETVTVIQGISAENPVPPSSNTSAMVIATIILPPYLYRPKLEPEIRMRDNRRFTMRDIANLEKRIENIQQIS